MTYSAAGGLLHGYTSLKFKINSDGGGGIIQELNFCIAHEPTTAMSLADSNIV